MASGEHNENENTTEAVRQFKQFDIVTDHSDHYYYSSSTKTNGCFTNARSSVHKKIMKEWNILEKNLPDSIFVQVYEGRIDLLRAVILGSKGTPYHDGLYIFDLAFPSEYPNSPPKARYLSRGLRLNPNLYSNGFVCLSLLNTWQGKTNEKWNPSQSTVLQVLLSIQALVLNEEPYFNEPGYSKNMANSKRYSREYNEQAFLLSCRTMLFLVRAPPKNFEDFVAHHFRERAHVILGAIKAYANGCLKVGYYTENESYSSSSVIRVSSSFKASMEQLYPILFKAFTDNGASLENYIEVVVDTVPSPYLQAIEENTKSSKIEKWLTGLILVGILLFSFWPTD